MNYSTYNISLDIHDTASQVSLNVKKGDTARRICAVFTENGKPYKIADGCTAVFRAKKPARDNGERAIVYNDTQIIDNKICYVVTSANTETAGVADCEFTLYGADGKAITSPKFTLVIDNTVNSDGEVENIGTNELTALTIAYDNATAATKSAKEAANSAKEATNSAKEAANSAKEAANDATGVANKIKQTAESGGFDGKDGAIYTPYVDNNGNLSWSNNGNLENPLTKNITGPRGVSGVYVGGGEMPEGYNVQIDPDGDASTRLEIGTVETLEEGQDATASISGTADAPILNLGIPRGTGGATPKIGPNGNWWIDGIDTGSPAQGPKGEPGNGAVLPWVQINAGQDTTMQDVVTFEFSIDKQYTELYVEGEILISTTYAAKTIYMRVCQGTKPIGVGAALSQTKNEDKVFLRAHGTISPSGGCVFAIAENKVGNSANIMANPESNLVTDGSFNGLTLNIMTNDPSNFKIGAGSVIKIWGR